MDIRDYVTKCIPKSDSPEKVYELFRGLKYPQDKLLNATYKRKIQEFGFAKEEREKVKEIYTVFNYDGKLQIFLIETKTLPISLVRYLAKNLSDKYLRFLLILTTDYKEYTFVFPEHERVEEGQHKLKLTRLVFDRENAYHTDLLTIANIGLTGEEENWRDIWIKWKDAFSVKKVTDEFFDDYKNAFFELRDAFKKQKISIKEAHELAQQFLNRLMFLYFISKKRWLSDDPKFIRWYWARYKEERRNGNAQDDTFYESWLKILFLEAFNNKYSHPSYHPQDIKKILAAAPYLNGGLFHRNELDDLPFRVTDKLFEKVLNFFEKYNFTIREDLPLDAEVAVDPQMIGYVYESLSNVAEEIYERQDLGIFYTPVIEVDFMCRRSLVEYLANHLPELPKEQIYKLLFDEDKKAVEDYITGKNLWYRLEEVLEYLAVVDPACGSGAFLVGMLHVLLELFRITYRHIKREMTEFELRKKIIGNSLYGVDVMPWAVHSAELRLWLQLIIEEDIPFEKRKLFPLLPNLSLRLRVGDSLVQEVGGINLHMRDISLAPSIKKKLTALKVEKEKYYNNDPTAKFKSDKALLHEEHRIFIEILDEKIFTLTRNNQDLEVRKRQVQPGLFDGNKKKAPAQMTLFDEQIKTNELQIELIRDTRRKIQDPGKKPFLWDIDFAEIFGDKGGFDIVIGNPPYVRQEKISPPNKLKAEVTLEDKKEYKDKLLRSIQTHFPFIEKIDRKSDFYIYFYFHGLSLLNEQGTFCFITSNSWLDVGYGKDLQEFLLKWCPIKAIYDNQAKRSFEHADVNTIIALFGSPQRSYFPSLKGGQGGIWPTLENTARFVMFRRPFEEAINTRNLLDIEKAGSIHKTEAYRVYPVKQETLLEEGWEYPEEDSQESEVEYQESGVRSQKSAETAKTGGMSSTSLRGTTVRSNIILKEKFLTGKYNGNKWSGRYFRMSDSMITALKHLRDQAVPLKQLLSYDYGLKPGVVDFFYIDKKLIKQFGIESQFYRPMINSSRAITGYIAKPNTYVFWCHNSIRELTGTGAKKYIEWGIKQKYHEVSSVKSHRPYWYSLNSEPADCILLQFWDRRFWTPRVEGSTYVSNNFYYGKLMKAPELVLAMLNSILFFLQIECYGRTNQGLGVLTTYGPDFEKIRMPLTVSIQPHFKQKLVNAYKELSMLEVVPLNEDVKRKERQALDSAMIESIGLKPTMIDELYIDLIQMMNNRLSKADSLKKETL